MSRTAIYKSTGRLPIILLIMFLFLSANALAQEDTTWYWRRGDDPITVKRTKAALDSLLKLHWEWIDSDSAKGKQLLLPGAYLVRADLEKTRFDRADLRNANLQNANLKSSTLDYALLDSANLSYSNLDSTSLSWAYLTYAKLNGASLKGADLHSTNLESARLQDCQMQNAFLYLANLKQADLIRSNLTNVRLDRANMDSCNLDSVRLSGVSMYLANLTGTFYEAIDSLPIINSIAFATGLKNLRYRGDPSALVTLREEFARKGFKKQEREVICALYRNKPFSKLDKILNHILFDWTSEYGSNLSRPWHILFWIWVLCGIAYYLSMLNKFKPGIYLYAQEPHIDKAKICIKNPTIKKYASRLIQNIPMWVRLFWWAFFFSTMSAFNIGFRDINFGRWLRLLTQKEFDLKPNGWIRIVSGIQAITSVYLIALWILSFAGTPFK